MVAEDRIARVESDVAELKGSVNALEARFTAFTMETVKKFGELETKMESGFGVLRTEIEKSRVETEKSRVETEKGFGALRAKIDENRAHTDKSLESLRTSIESAKLWMLVTGVGSVMLVTFVTFLGRALKLFCSPASGLELVACFEDPADDQETHGQEG